MTAIIGPSGCGKSTLIRCLNRMNDLIPSFRVEGQVLFEGQDIYARGLDPVDVRRRIGMVFQKPNPFPKSIYENVAFGPRIIGYSGRLDDIVEQCPAAGRPLGRGQGHTAAQRAHALRRTAAAALHRPRPGRRAGGDPDG